MDKFIAHILVVDDDEGIRSLVKKYLNEKKYLVTTANNAEDASEKIKIIKFDIEGYEYEVIKNFKLINQIQSIIIFEYNVKYLKRIYKDQYNILLKFLDSNFDIYSIDKSDYGEIILKKINPDISSEVLAIPKKFKSSYKNLIN